VEMKYMRGRKDEKGKMKEKMKMERMYQKIG
jgi:hypothetical protein